MKNKKGFTLIELIVSITIIAVLTVAGVISYGGANKKARDNRRMADLEKIRIQKIIADSNQIYLFSQNQIKLVEKNNLIAAKVVQKNKRRGNSHLRL